MSNPPKKDQTDDAMIVTQAPGGYAPPKLEPEKYRHYLEELNLTSEQEREFLETIWNILRTFVDIGYGLDSVQLFHGATKEMAGVQSSDALEKTKPDDEEKEVRDA